MNGRRVAWVVLVAALLTPVAPASAAPEHAGSCTFSAGAVEAGSVSDGSMYSGTITAYSTMPATVRCFLRVNGVDTYFEATSSGSGLLPVYEFVQFQASGSDVVELCAELRTPEVDYQAECTLVTATSAPPPEVEDVVYPFVDEVVWNLDTTICQVLPVADVPPVITHDHDDGDTYVLVAGRVYDCPPYSSGPTRVRHHSMYAHVEVVEDQP